MRSKLFVFVSLLILVSMVLSACQQATPTPEKIIQTVVVEGQPKEVVVTATPGPVEAVTGPKTLRLNMGPGDIPTLDPSLATSRIVAMSFCEPRS